MRKSDALNVVLCAPAIICFCTSAMKDAGNRYSMTQATVQQRDGGQVKTHTPAFHISSPDPKACPFSGELVPDKWGSGCTTEADFSQRLQGGVLVRFQSGLIVVKPAVQPDSLRSTALTTDAIITSSIRSKIADGSQLQARNFDIQTDNGVVTIHAKGESLDQAATVINLALAVPDVRQIVYTMPLNV
jgi:BON domain